MFTFKGGIVHGETGYFERYITLWKTKTWKDERR